MTVGDEILDDVLEQEAAVEDEPAHEVQEDPAEDLLERLSDQGCRAREEAPPEAHVERSVADAQALDNVTVRDLLGIPLWYERVATPRPAAFPVARSFLPTLESIVRQVKQRAPAGFGPLERISSAGMYVEKAGMHGLGRACDIDRLTFADLAIAPIRRDHASSSLARRRRYWALGAICRANTCFVLHGQYNAAHADHVHVDNALPASFNTRPSTVQLCQAVANDIFAAKLSIDGEYGPKTREALAAAGETLQLDGHPASTPTLFRRFLLRSGRLGFRLSLSG